VTIGQLAKKSGVPASTIRYWERTGVIPPPARHSGQRRYGGDAIARLAVIRLAQNCGFRLDEMRRLVEGFSDGEAPASRWREFARRKRIELDDELARLQRMRRMVDLVAGCKCEDWNECGQRAIEGAAKFDKWRRR